MLISVRWGSMINEESRLESWINDFVDWVMSKISRVGDLLMGLLELFWGFIRKYIIVYRRVICEGIIIQHLMYR